jgi:hypothetical protein
MVTFRFYLVSVVAFFLALAVGVVVGSVLDDGISRGLQERLDGVEKNLDATVALVDGKNREIAQLQEFARAVAPFAGEDRLDDTSTLVVAEPGIPNQAVEDLVGSLRSAGSSVEGVLWLEASWSLGDDESRRRFEEIAGDSGLTVEQLHADAIDAILAEATTSGTGGVPGDEGTTEGNPEDTVAGSVPDEGGAGTESRSLDFFDSPLLAQLQEAGFLRVVPLGGGEATQPGSNANVVAVTGAESRLEVPGSAAADVANAAGALGIPAVLAEVEDPDDDQARGEIVMGAVEVASSPFSTVDDLELVAGRVATVLALQQGRGGVVGRYGYGSGADGVLPPWPGQ